MDVGSLRFLFFLCNDLRENTLLFFFTKFGLLLTFACIWTWRLTLLSNIYKAVDALAPQSRRVILISLQELSNGEIAEELNISVNSVRTLKPNAYKKLKGLLKDYFYIFFYSIGLVCPDFRKICN